MQDVLPYTGIERKLFWDNFQVILDEFIPRNQTLLETRDEMQQQIDLWHIQNQEFSPQA